MNNKKVEKFVSLVINKKNSRATKKLEEIFKEKCAKKIAETLKS